MQTWAGTVAENKRVCRCCGKTLMMPSRLFRNPMSSNWSASSRTKTFTFCNCFRTSGFDSIWSSNLPGVPTRIYKKQGEKSLIQSSTGFDIWLIHGSTKGRQERIYKVTKERTWSIQEQEARTQNSERSGWRIVMTWHGWLPSLFVSEFMLVPPITTCTPRPFWNVISIVASLAAWLASSRVGQMITTFTGLLPAKPWEPRVFRIVSIAGSYTKHQETQLKGD